MERSVSQLWQKFPNLEFVPKLAYMQCLASWNTFRYVDKKDTNIEFKKNHNL